MVRPQVPPPDDTSLPLRPDSVVVVRNRNEWLECDSCGAEFDVLTGANWNGRCRKCGKLLSSNAAVAQSDARKIQLATAIALRICDGLRRRYCCPQDPQHPASEVDLPADPCPVCGSILVKFSDLIWSGRSDIMDYVREHLDELLLISHEAPYRFRLMLREAERTPSDLNNPQNADQKPFSADMPNPSP